MAIDVERISPESRLINPGSTEHLEHFINLEHPKFFSLERFSRLEMEDHRHPYAFRMDHQNDRILAKFMAETQITRSIGLFTKRLQTFRPVKTGSLELDTRLFKTGEPWIPLFRSTINRPKAHPLEWTLFLHGKSRPWEVGESNIGYDINLPINIDYSFDPRRPAQAIIHDDYAVVSTYDQAAYPEYGTCDPNDLINALKLASSDLGHLVKYIYGVDQNPWYVSPDQEDRLSHQRIRAAAPVIANLLKYF